VAITVHPFVGKPVAPSMLVACDTDHDRHEIVTRSAGLLPPNHSLSFVACYLFQHCPKWRKDVAVGRTSASRWTPERLSARQIRPTDLAEEKIRTIPTRAPSNDGSIGRLKITTDNDRFPARPSRMKDIYKIYAESFRGADYLEPILEEAQAIVSDALQVEVGAASRPPV
jgi:phosphoglucomutase